MSYCGVGGRTPWRPMSYCGLGGRTPWRPMSYCGLGLNAALCRRGHGKYCVERAGVAGMMQYEETYCARSSLGGGARASKKEAKVAKLITKKLMQFSMRETSKFRSRHPTPRPLHQGSHVALWLRRAYAVASHVVLWLMLKRSAVSPGS